MKFKIDILGTALFLLCSSACTQAQKATENIGTQDSLKAAKANEIKAPEIPMGAQCLIKCYPQYVKGYENNQIILANGVKLPYDDGKKKTHIQQMDNADIEDMFAQAYDTSVWVPTKNYDPGRMRNEELLKQIYGQTKQEVLKKMVRVEWFGQKLPFSSINGAADSLKAVEKDLKSNLPATYNKYFAQSSTFNWRTVRGSNRLSAHSFGITIDICTKYSDFWRWSNPGKNENDTIKYVNRIPKEIIRIFEKHGFISGTRWYHYDTMHFEFRPDLLMYKGE